jgi:hypothetical protein
MKRILHWAQQHVNCTNEQWVSVIWSNELRFTVTGNDEGARGIRKVGKRQDAKHIFPTKKFGNGDVMI